MEYKEIINKILLGNYQKFTDESRKALDQTFEQLISTLEQRRGFYKHITLITLAVLGLIPLVQEKVKIAGYFYFGISCLFLIVILLIIRLREEIDYDGNNLYKKLDSPNIFDSAAEITLEYIQKEPTKENYDKYQDIIKTQSSIININRVERNENEIQDYTLEFVIFLLIVGMGFIIFSISADEKLRIIYLIPSILGIFLFTFFVPTRLIIYPINFVLNFKRRLKLK